MRVTVITPAMHFRNSGAAQNDVYACLKHLRVLGHNVALLTIDSDKQDPETLSKIEREYGVTVRKINPQKSSILIWLLRSLTDPALFDRAAFAFSEFIRDRRFDQAISDLRPDAVISFLPFSWPAILYLKKKGIRLILRSHNFEPTFFWEEITLTKRLLPSNWLRFVAKWIGEKRAVQNADAVGTLLFSGVSKYRKWAPGKIFDLTLMFPAFTMRGPWVHENKTPLDVAYLGASYNVIFHLRGAELLIERIAPEIHKRAPGAFRFHVLGSKLPECLVKKCDGVNTIYEGYVLDLNSFLENVDIGAFPVFTGTTMKGKVFDTLTRSFPVVIPPVGVGEYKFTHGTQALIAPTPEAFVEEILKLRDDSLRKKLSIGAHEFTKETFGVAKIESVLTELLTGNRVIK